MPDLRDHTTLRLGGPAREWVRATSEAEVVDAVTEADAAGTPLLLLGGGSNLVVADAGFDGRVVEVATRGTRVDSDACSGASLTVAAGEGWDDLVAHAVEQGWTGIEALSGIPGAVGATPIQNVGAYGQDVAQTVSRVRAWDRVDRTQRTFAAADCGFSYRHSRFKADPGRYVVLDVTFQLGLGDLGAPVQYAELARTLGVAVGERAPLAEVREAVLGLRRRQGHGPRPCRPRHLECRVVLHQPPPGPRPGGTAPRRRTALGAGRRRGQVERCVADRARRLRQGPRQRRPPATG